MSDTQSGSRLFKPRWDVFLAGGKSVSEFKSVVRLDTFHRYTASFEVCKHFLQKVGRGVSTLFLVGSEIPQPAEFVNGGILIQSQFGIGNTGSGYNLYIDLYPLSRILHLFIGFGLVWLLRL